MQHMVTKLWSALRHHKLASISIGGLSVTVLAWWDNFSKITDFSRWVSPVMSDPSVLRFMHSGWFPLICLAIICFFLWRIGSAAVKEDARRAIQIKEDRKRDLAPVAVLARHLFALRRLSDAKRAQPAIENGLESYRAAVDEWRVPLRGVRWRDITGRTARTCVELIHCQSQEMACVPPVEITLRHGVPQMTRSDTGIESYDPGINQPWVNNQDANIRDLEGAVVRLAAAIQARHEGLERDGAEIEDSMYGF